MKDFPDSDEIRDQIISQMKLEANNEDTTGLSPEDIEALGQQLFDWARQTARGEQDVRFRLLDDRSIVETVSPDMPFIVDSLLGECSAQGHAVRALFHPVITLADGHQTSVTQAHLPLLTEDEGRRLVDGIRKTLADITVTVSDYQDMRARMEAEIARLETLPHLEGAEKEEAVAFLEWLTQDHYVFLGARTYRFQTDEKGNVLPEEPVMIDGTNLGLLRNEDANVLSRDSEPLILTRAIGDMLSEPFPLVVSKSTLVSRVHRRVPADYVGVKHYDGDGNVVGETRFLGLFTAEAYDETVRSIPLLRRRLEKVIVASGASRDGHAAKALANIMESWPRDELFQTSSRDLAPMIRGALHLIGRPRVRVFLRYDQFGRHVSAIVYVPREAYDSDLRKRIANVLSAAFDGQVRQFQPYFDSGPLARVHFLIGLKSGYVPPDCGALEQEIAALSRTWGQGYREALMAADMEADARAAAAPYVDAFNAAYREAFGPEEALLDTQYLTALSEANPLKARAYRNDGEPDSVVRVKIYARGQSIPLSRCVPVFENMGLFVEFETGFPVDREGEPLWVHALSMKSEDGRDVPLAKVASLLEDAFVAVWRGQAENDGFNHLTLAANMGWRQAALFRALCSYRRQTGMAQPQAIQQHALVSYPAISTHLMEMFAARFEPNDSVSLEDRSEACAKLSEEIETALKDVEALSDDQVLRQLAQLIRAIQRTNFYQLADSGEPPSFISFKVASQELETLPEPKPYREIFVSGPKVDGVHLRFGPVARGGLRWSDRPSDYRTEVLGLVKAQQVKNAVIVPVGSKGGFYPKQLPDRSDRNAWVEAGRDAYKVFIRALLEVTDNLDGADVVHPSRTVIWDGDDPYLVVAADKGTATFSDTANAISESHGFWLGDAFASGGSAGYDHKKMGITARGAWEAVKRHFREMGRDIQTEPFSTIGVGDMSGDVFGNGMLLSKETRLIAAFNHMHIFIDPDPSDARASFAERQRLFDTQGSTWADYKSELISDGGGVFSRAAKSVHLSPQIKSLTGLTTDEATPDKLIHALLKADVDLLWFGGIGTYVKAGEETHADAGDRANDAIRVNADELRVRVIGEGANLGMTQAARIAFALGGGRINTDAIDNSAGVDSSDHEVNIKILAAEAIRLGKLASDDRNELLAEMTDEVAALVLRHNYDQTHALTLAEANAAVDHDALERLMVYLEDRGALNRGVEGLPDTAQMEQRGNQGQYLTRPELAVLLAWSKITLFDDLVASDIPDDPYFDTLMTDYFPSPIDQQDEAKANHRLRREITSTIIANRVLDMEGPVALLRLREMTGHSNADVVKGLEAARAVLSFADFKTRVDALDNEIPARTQTRLRLKAGDAMVEAAAWFTRTLPDVTVGEKIEQTHEGLNAFKSALRDVHTSFPAANIEQATRNLVSEGAPDDLARWASAMHQFAIGLEVIQLADMCDVSVETAGACFYRIGDVLRLDRLRHAAREGLAEAGYWDRIAGRRLVNDLVRLQARATQQALSKGSADAWIEAHAETRRILLETSNGFVNDPTWSFARFALAVDAVRHLLGD